jgi:hypothetical protein
VALFGQQRGGHRGVDAARHGYRYPHIEKCHDIMNYE